MLPNSWGGPPRSARRGRRGRRPAVQGDRPTIYSGHRSGLFKWHWAKAPAPQPYKPLRTKVGRTLSSVNPVLRRIRLLPPGKLRRKRSADGHKLRVLVLVDPFARVHVEVVYLAGTFALVAKHQLVSLVPDHIGVL